ncbi:MAG: TonB-dependent receptor, partial [Amphiplicatus sp.]
GDAELGSFENLTYHLSYTYGRLEQKFFSPNNLVLDRFYAAMDAVIDPGTGQPTCRSNLDPSALPPQIPFPGGFGFLGFFDAFNTTVTPDNYGTTPFFTPGPNSGCEPLNLFGRSNASPEAVAFVNDDSLRVATVQQHVLTGYISGDTSGVFELPAGPIGFALGGEWRKERSNDTPPVINTEGLTFGNQIFPTKGEYSVGEGFVEISVPVLKDLPLAHGFSIDAAFRASNYSTVGYTQAWNVGAIYSPVEEVRFRGTYSRAVRAPNIAELFSPQNQSFFLPDDPCDIDNIPLAGDPALRAANCAAILGPLGVDPATFQGDDILNATFPGLLGGNPDLSEEGAKTWTVGAVWQPSFIDGLSLIIDYYNMTITDGIIAPDEQDIVDQCVDLSSIDNQFCSLITRRSDGGLSFLEVVPVNVAFFETSGIDYEIGYTFDPADIGAAGIGQFQLRYIGSYLQKLDVVSLPGQAADVEKNETGTLLGDDAPTHAGALNLSWLLGPVTATYRWQFRNRLYRDEIDEFESAAAQGNVLFSPMKTSRLSTHDIQVRYAVREKAEIYVGVNNLLDQEPDIGFTDTPIDAIGRFVYAGFTWRLN